MNNVNIVNNNFHVQIMLSTMTRNDKVLGWQSSENDNNKNTKCVQHAV